MMITMYCNPDFLRGKYQIFTVRLLILAVSCPGMPLAADPLNRKDVIGQYQLANEHQCQRLCWYRQLCSSYSYNLKDQGGVVTPPPSSAAPNCVLHTDSVPTDPDQDPKLTTQDDACKSCSQDHWLETPASGSTITNACHVRPCNVTSVCVPHFPSSTSSSFTCLPMPASCGPPPPVAHGNVSVSGTLQGDTAHVTCDVSFVMSPADASCDVTCQATARWTPLLGECLQYEFFTVETGKFTQLLPTPVQDSEICVRGVFNGGQMIVNLQPGFFFDNVDLRLLFRYNYKQMYGVLWTTKKDSEFPKGPRRVGDMPLRPGDPFTLTLTHPPLCDRLHVALNLRHVYSVPLIGHNQRREEVDSVDLSRSKVMSVRGDVEITYVNLMSGCTVQEDNRKSESESEIESESESEIESESESEQLLLSQ